MAEIDPKIHYILSTNRGVRGELKEVRDSVYDAAKGLFAAHDHPKGAKITKSSGRVDQYVNLEDTGEGKGEPAAAAIEFGYTDEAGKEVDGLHILRRALGSV